jgi:hypothetical protein
MLSTYYIVGLHYFALVLTSSATLRNAEMPVNESLEPKTTQVVIPQSIELVGHDLDSRIMGLGF